MKRARITLAIPCFVGAIVVLYGVQLWISVGPHSVFGDPAVMVRQVYANGGKPLLFLVSLAIAALEGLAMWALYRRACGSRPAALPVPWIAVGAAVMFTASLLCANPNFDAYDYVGYGKYAHFAQAYVPPAHWNFGHGFEFLTAHEGRGSLPALDYGPMWLALDRAIVAPCRTLTQAFLALRLFNVFLIMAAVVCIVRITRNAAVYALILLNPAILFYYVVEAHNDLLAVVLVLAGILLGVRRPWVGAILASGAGLVKITFAAIALLSVDAGRNRWSGVLRCAAILCAVIIGSAAFGGAPYAASMLGMGHHMLLPRNDLSRLFGLLMHAAAAAMGAVAIFCAVFLRRRFTSGAYGLSTIGALVLPHYLAWPLPYVVCMRAFAPAFLASMPLVTAFVDTRFLISQSHAFALTDLYYLAIALAGATQCGVLLKETAAEKTLSAIHGRPAADS